MVEHIVHNTDAEEGWRQTEVEAPYPAVREAALEVERPIFFSLMIIIARTSLCSRWSAWNGGCSRRWHSRCYALIGSMLA